MAQVSKRYLHQQVEGRILDLFWTSLSLLSNKADMEQFLDDLLTPTEKLMLAKRIAVAFMLTKGYNYPDINEQLKVSDPTIWQIKTKLQFAGKGYKRVIAEIMQREEWEERWNKFEHFLSQLVPPRAGTNWREVRRKQWEKRRKQQKPF